ncbi:hypothetical protein GIB67_016786, partial [Kingdonia uniflora]
YFNVCTKDAYLHSIVRCNENPITATAAVSYINKKSIHHHIYVLKRSHSQPKNHGAIVVCPCHHEA